MTAPKLAPVQDAPDESLVPGGMAVRKERRLPGGYLVQFEWAPVGYLKRDGEPRSDEWRAYYLSAGPTCAACEGSGRTPSTKREGATVKCKSCDGTGTPKRERVQSVTTICDAILPKDGLPPWSERMGITGAMRAMRAGLLTAMMSDEDAVQVVRGGGMGADRARDEAADRGLDVHAILEAFMLTGTPPNPAQHPEPHRPFIRGLVRWIVKMQSFGGIEPVAVETLVADPERGYAGRLDLLARTAAGLTLIDLKTQQDGCIYESAHVQARLYADAEERYGEHRIDHAIVVVVDGRGGYREMDLCADSDLTAHALDYYRRLKPLAAGCDSQNRAIKKALAAAA